MVKVKNISADGFKRLKADFDQMNRGPKQAGKVFYGDGDWEWVQLGVSPQDAEFLQQRRFSVEEICRWFGVPPQMVGDTSKQTFANFEQAGLNFFTLAIMPWGVRFEQESNRKLLPRVGSRRPFLKLNTAALVRANLEAQYRSFALGRQFGWLSVNDIRRLIDMEPSGPEGRCLSSADAEPHIARPVSGRRSVRCRRVERRLTWTIFGNSEAVRRRPCKKALRYRSIYGIKLII
jgi:HK97 family phage portal protein